MARFLTLPSALAGTRSREDHAAFAADPVKLSFNRLNVPSFALNLQRFGSHAVRKTAVKHYQESTGGDARAPLLQSRQGYCGRGEIVRIGVMRDDREHGFRG